MLVESFSYGRRIIIKCSARCAHKCNRLLPCQRYAESHESSSTFVCDRMSVEWAACSSDQQRSVAASGRQDYILYTLAQQYVKQNPAIFLVGIHVILYYIFGKVIHFARL